MALSYEQTKVLMERILNAELSEARSILRNRLSILEKREPEFYTSVIQHCPSMNFSPEEWFDFLSKIPTRVLRAERQIMNKLSESQREKLPPASLG